MKIYKQQHTINSFFSDKYLKKHQVMNISELEEKNEENNIICDDMHYLDKILIVPSKYTLMISVVSQYALSVIETKYPVKPDIQYILCQHEIEDDYLYANDNTFPFIGEMLNYLNMSDIFKYIRSGFCNKYVYLSEIQEAYERKLNEN